LEAVLQGNFVGEVVYVSQAGVQAETTCWWEGMSSISSSRASLLANMWARVTEKFGGDKAVITSGEGNAKRGSQKYISNTIAFCNFPAKNPGPET
jgi:hypothetical protein